MKNKKQTSVPPKGTKSRKRNPKNMTQPRTAKSGNGRRY